MNHPNQGRCEGGFVGCTLRSLRVITQMSQRELANRASVTHSAISQIEKGLISPSIQFLHKVLSGVPIDLATFFSLNLCDFSLDPCGDNGAASNAATEQLPITQGGSTLSSHSLAVTNRERGSNLCSARFEKALAPNESLPLLCNASETLIWCARGIITVRSHRRSLSLHPGDSLLLPVNSPFVVGNADKQDSKCGIAPIYWRH